MNSFPPEIAVEKIACVFKRGTELGAQNNA